MVKDLISRACSKRLCATQAVHCALKANPRKTSTFRPHGTWLLQNTQAPALFGSHLLWCEYGMDRAYSR